MSETPRDEQVRVQIEERERKTEAVFLAMRDLGLHPGDAIKRRERAEDLVRAGLTEARLRLLGEHVQQTTDGIHRAAKILAWTLAEPERWEPLLTDLEWQAGRITVAEKEDGIEHVPNMPPGARCCECKGCKDHRARSQR